MTRRRVSALAKTAWGTAFSRGRGYERLVALPLAYPGRVDEYYIDYSPKRSAPDPATRPDATPATHLQWALGWWQRARLGDSAAVETFTRSARRIVDMAEDRGAALLWRYDVPVPKYGLESPWYSALAQGQAASVLVRAHRLTREDDYRRAAIGAVAPLIDHRAGLVSETVDGPILEEAPTDPPSHILNGWILGLWGLRDVGIGLDDRAAAEAYDRGLECLRATISRYDTGWWTRYSLYPHRLEDLAKPIYHRFHVEQVEALLRMTGETFFADIARRWRGYDRPANRLRALGQKSLFVVAGGRRP